MPEPVFYPHMDYESRTNLCWMKNQNLLYSRSSLSEVQGTTLVMTFQSQWRPDLILALSGAQFMSISMYFFASHDASSWISSFALLFFLDFNVLLSSFSLDFFFLLLSFSSVASFLLTGNVSVASSWVSFPFCISSNGASAAALATSACTK